MQALAVSEEHNTTGVGRPRLVENEDTKPVTIRIPESLYEKVQDLPRGDLPKAVRAFIYAYLDVPEGERWRAKDPDLMRAAVAKVVKMSRALDQ